VKLRPAESAGKRRAIVDAATDLFLSRGYAGTSMDEVAAQAAVSKRTVYKQFADKDGLFAEVVMGVSGTVDAFIDSIEQALTASDNLPRDLGGLARIYVKTVMQPRVLQLRRLLIGEATRFPELGRHYYERGPERVIAAIAGCVARLAARGLLHAPGCPAFRLPGAFDPNGQGAGPWRELIFSGRAGAPGGCRGRGVSGSLWRGRETAGSPAVQAES